MDYGLDNTYLDRRSDRTICVVCTADWPCAGARRQLADAARFTHEHWFDDERFAQLTEQVVREAQAEIARAERTKRRTAKEEAA
jgi:hypothetical protein